MRRLRAARSITNETNVSIVAALIMLGTLTRACAVDGKIAIVAAENFYGDVAQQIGGDSVSVISVLNRSPNALVQAPREPV